MRLSRRGLGLIVAVATLAAAFSLVLAYQTVRNSGKTPDVLSLAILNASFWFGWAALALPLAAVVERWRIHQRPRVAIPVHLAAALAAGAAHIGLQAVMRSIIVATREPGVSGAFATFSARIGPEYRMQLLQLIDWELLAAGGIIAIAHALFYYRETQARALREAQLETRLVEAQLLALQQKLQPHFLFNTLHAISTLMHRDVALADRMLVRLSDLLRIALDVGGQREVTLGREIDFLKSYLEIERTRIGERLTVEYDVHPAALDGLVPTLILQPLVENAVKHGVSRQAGPARIAVAGRLDGGSLCLSVSDTGPGPDASSRPGGIGLANVRARLQHHYGGRGVFSLDASGGGCIARIVLPFRVDPARREPA
jgi:signal transduction histidine kinase